MLGGRFGFRQEDGQLIYGHKWKDRVCEFRCWWVDQCGDRRLSEFCSVCFCSLNEVEAHSLFSHSAFSNMFLASATPLMCAHHRGQILIHICITCILFLCLYKPYSAFRVQLRIPLLRWAFHHHNCLKSSFTLYALSTISVRMHYLAPVT